MERDGQANLSRAESTECPLLMSHLKKIRDQESSADTFSCVLSVSKCIVNVFTGSLYIINHMFYSLYGSGLLCVDVSKPADISWNKSFVW